MVPPVAWALLAALGLAPALAGLLTVASPVLAGLATLWGRTHPTPPRAEGDPPPAPTGRGLLGALLVAVVELSLPACAATWLGVPVPWPAAFAAAIGGGLAWAVIIRQIPHAAGFSLGPAVLGASLGAGLGALLGGWLAAAT